MEWHSIFKHRKKLLFIANIAIFLLLSLFLNSCQDSLGYDPNVSISPIGKDTTTLPPDDEQTPTVFTIDSIIGSFKETIRNLHSYKTYRWHGTTVKKEIKFDTSNSKKKLWIKWAMITTNKDTDYIPIRIDRVVGFELVFAAVLHTRSFDLDLDKDSRRWFLLRIKRARTQKVCAFDRKDLDAKITFVENDKTNGILKFLLMAKIPLHAPFQTKLFEGFVEIYYKKK
jgi:hypothetical protein